ncbi:MAG: tetratricopeptide repeat protein [Candidatus Alcyoniella australis]|nr:tetratricopeptide repeat protein [Candidatus Alcyoniella australis]
MSSQPAEGTARSLLPLCLLIAALTCLAYLPTLAGDFVWDDLSLIRDNPHLGNPANLPRYFTNDLGRFNQFPHSMNFYRPLQPLTFFVEYRLWGLNPFGFHLTNLLLHICASLAAFKLLLLLAPGRIKAAVFGALLFALHPVHVEQVAMVGNRGGLLATLFVLLSLIYGVRALGGERRAYAWSLITMTLALLSKESAIVLPALLMLCALIFHRELWRRGTRGKLALFAAGHWLLAAAYLAWRSLLGIALVGQGSGLDLGRQLAATPPLLFDHLRVLLLPLYLRPYYSIAAQSPAATLWWIKLAVLILVAVLLLLAARRSRIAAFGVGFYILSVAPFLNVASLNKLFVEHYLYLPSLGLAALCTALPLDRASRFSKAIGALVAINLLLFGAISFDRSLDWRSDIRLWTRAVATDPGSPEAFNNLGSAYYQLAKAGGERSDERLILAADAFNRSLELFPANPEAAYNLGLCQLALNDPTAAIVSMRHALRFNPDYDRALIGLGLAAVRSDIDNAHQALVGIDQPYRAASVHLGLATGYGGAGRNDLAIEHFRVFLDGAAPDHPQRERVERHLLYLVERQEKLRN